MKSAKKTGVRRTGSKKSDFREGRVRRPSRSRNRTERKNRQRIARKTARKAIKSDDSITLRPQFTAEIPRTVVFLLLLYVCTYLSLENSSLWLNFNNIYLFGFRLDFSIPFIQIFPVMLFLMIIFKLFNERYLLTEDGILEITGLVTPVVRTVEIQYQNIRAAEVVQTWYDMIFNIGNVLVGSTVSAVGEITMYGIKNPKDIKRIIKERVKEAQMGLNPSVRDE